LHYAGFEQAAALAGYVDKLKNGGDHAYFEDDQVP
jgi:hypothetical protein